MYFDHFPLTYYSLYDDVSNVKIGTNITTRVRISDEAKNKIAIYDEYDIRDGETPEIVADRFYNNPQLHWIILHVNDILDPRFDWPLSVNNLLKFCEGKYTNVNGTHHYEDSTGNVTNGNVILTSSSSFNNFYVGNVIINDTGSGTAVITSKLSSSNIFILATEGGFSASDRISLYSNASVNANITSTVTVSGTPVTNYYYEDVKNESKRRIRILKTAYVNSLINDFKNKLEI